ncbi:TetR/AcrR family transcriptional regulator [Micromonospora sp. CPCC 206061]|uniref:TetR/AcrR family transcriptional regulator n=1 Tax=Micromonospora sp. CPCC 206061 TaxID=3122410 RepID=UPI002FF3036A
MSSHYHHGDLRSALIEAGMTMARAKGVGTLGIRELARAVGVSPNAAYRHFASLRALVLTVAQEAQHRLSRAILDRMDAVPGEASQAERASARLRAFGLAYIHFAVTEPGWFALTCESQEDPPGPLATEPPPPPPHQILLDTLDAMVEARVMTPQGRVDVEWSCWSTVHGFAMLATAGPLQAMPPDATARLADRVIGTLLKGLQN